MEPAPISEGGFEDLTCAGPNQPVPAQFLGQSMPPVPRIAPSQALTLSSSACVRPAPEGLRTVWKAELIGRGSSYVPHTDPRARSDAQMLMPSAVRDDKRVWTPNLNEHILQRQRHMNSELWDTYRHMNARQASQQFLQAGILKRRDKYMRQVPLEAALSVEQQLPPRQPCD